MRETQNVSDAVFATVQPVELTHLVALTKEHRYFILIRYFLAIPNHYRDLLQDFIPDLMLTFVVEFYLGFIH